VGSLKICGHLCPSESICVVLLYLCHRHRACVVCVIAAVIIKRLAYMNEAAAWLQLPSPKNGFVILVIFVLFFVLARVSLPNSPGRACQPC
jgi:hypothetical protein